MTKESKKNLQSEEWKNAKTEIKTKIIREYLATAYVTAKKECEITVNNVKYKVLKREDKTTFYGENGNTLFDVTNEELEKKEEVVKVDKPVPEEAVLKLQQELNKAKDKTFAEPCIEYLIERCKNSVSLASDVCQKHKTWEKCYNYIYERARKKLNNKSAPVRSDEVFEWAEDYYRKDDKAEEEKKAKEAAKRKKKADERRKKDVEKKKQESKDKSSAEKKKDIPKKPESTKPNKNSKEMEGQMDFFSMMGM